MNGLNVFTNEAVPKDKMFLVPPWFGECRIIAGVAVRLRRRELRPDGKEWDIFSPLTEEEKYQFAVLNNCAPGTISPTTEMNEPDKSP